MSKHVKTAMARTRTRNAAARLVLAVLAAHADEKFIAWPSQQTIAGLCGVTTRTVRNALNELKRLEEISVALHGQGRGSTRHRLDILTDRFELVDAT